MLRLNVGRQFDTWMIVKAFSCTTFVSNNWVNEMGIFAIATVS